MTNKEKFLALVSEDKTNTLEQNKERIKNRAMLRESQRIALKVLARLDELKWTQKDLAQALHVTPQQVNKIVSGKENLTIETQIKLQDTLDIPVLASYYENKMYCENKMNAMEETEGLIKTIHKSILKIAARTNPVTTNYKTDQTIKIKMPQLFA